MKKMLIAAAIVCAAVVSQAALAVTWQSGSGVKDKAGNTFTATTAKDYVCEIAFSTNEDMSDPMTVTGTTSSSYNGKGGVGFNGKTSETFDAGNTYYTRITITAKDGSVYTSDIGSFTIAQGALAGPTVNFTSGANMGSKSLIGDTKYVAAPEPTSAMLVLLGLAGLALKRKRA